MRFIVDMVLEIIVLEGKAFSLDCAYYTMESITISEILMYGNKCTVELVLSLRFLMLHSDVGLC